jgi:hypothetical protein
MAIGALNTLIVHSSSAAARAASTMSTFGAANAPISAGEDATSIVGIILAFLHPYLAAILAALFVMALIVIAVVIAAVRSGARRNAPRPRQPADPPG